MTKLGEISEMRAKPGMRPALLELLATSVDDIVATEPGTEVAIFHADVDDEVTVWIYVLFADQTARDVHRSKVAERDALRARIGPLVEGPTKQTVATVEFGKLP